ncbi:hypothetical protein D3C77_422250 [compost metagenome]
MLKGSQVRPPQALLTTGQPGRFEFLDERRHFHGDSFNCGCSGAGAGSAQCSCERHVLDHIHQVIERLLAIAAGPAVEAFEDFVAQLGDCQREHQLPQPRHEKAAECKRIESQLDEIGTALVGSFLILQCRGHGMK